MGSNKHTYEILVTGPLCISECVGECRFPANLCKRALDVNAGVIVEATCNADMLRGAVGEFSVNLIKKYFFILLHQFNLHNLIYN